jgi:putative membrane protein
MSLTEPADKSFYVFNAVVSVAAVAFLGWLLMINRGTGAAADLSFLPGVNAALNAAAATLLVAGFFAIRAGNRALHMRLMVAALACSGVFLVSYVIYHYAHGDTKYTGEHRGLYFSILISHIVLSIGIVPMALQSVYFAVKERFDSHRRVARWLLPIWLYVSITGVVIYFMLRGSVPTGA